MTEYNKWSIPEYSGNPLIEALPRCLCKDDFFRLLKKLPAFSEEEREHNDIERDLYTERLDAFIMPNHTYYGVYKKLYKLIVKSYARKNPLKPSHKQLLYSTSSNNKNSPYPSDFIKTTADSLFITGLSGMGKTHMVEAILSICFAQLIEHTSYNDTTLNIKQVLYIKFNCPSDASRRALCLNFFTELDAVLGTSYRLENSNKNIPIETLEKNIKIACIMHNIGLLVIDELQNLSISKAGGLTQAMQFFESIANEILVSLLFIGTTDCYSIYADSFKTARRMSKDGCIELERPISKNDPYWKSLLSVLWKRQWVKKPCQLNDDITETIYGLTQGITVCTTTLLKLANSYAIDNEEETIDSDLLTEVYHEEMKLLHPALTALRNRQYGAFEELMPLAMRIKMFSVNAKSYDNSENPPEKNTVSSAIETR